MLQAIKQWLFGQSHRPHNHKRQLEDEIILLAGDDGDGLCRDAIHTCVNVHYPHQYSKAEIEECIDELLASGHLLTDGETYIDPHTLPNAAKRIRSGWMLLSHNRIEKD